MMGPTLEEVAGKCQKPRYKEVGNWMVRTFLRDWAVPCTWLCLRYHITANQVTLGAIIIAIAAGFSLAFQGVVWFFFGALLLQVWYYLDHVDGQIARFEGKASLSGRFFDFMMHHMVHVLVYFFLGLYMAFEYGVGWAVPAFFASLFIGMFNVMHDAKYKTFFEALGVNAHPAETTNPDHSEPTAHHESKFKAVLKTFFSILHKSNEIHVVMNTLTVVSFIALFNTQFDFRFLLFVFYFISSGLLFVGKMFFVINKQTVDLEYAEFHKSLNSGDES